MFAGQTILLTGAGAGTDDQRMAAWLRFLGSAVKLTAVKRDIYKT
jgi:hypothetical protein